MCVTVITEMSLNLDELNLSTLEADIVSDIWRDTFSSDSCLPDDYQDFLQNVRVDYIFKDICSQIRTALHCGAIHNWHSLVERGFEYKPLLCVIHHMLCASLRCKEDDNLRKRGLHAASLYFTLLSVPDSSMYRIYHSSLYARAMDVLRFVDLVVRRKSSVSSRSSKSRGRRGPSSCHLEEEREEASEHLQMPAYESGKLICKLCKTLNDLNFALDKGNVGRCDDAAIQTIELLAKLTRLETFDSDIHRSRSEDSSIKALARSAFMCLEKLCHPRHGDVKENVRMIMKCMLLSIQLPFEKDSGIAPREANVVKNNAIGFVHIILNSVGAASYDGISTLVQFLCFTAPERAEPRLKAAEDVVTLVQGFPNEFFGHITLFFLKLSLNEKPSCRLFSLELIGRLLNLDERVVDEEEPGNRTKLELEIPSHKYLIAAVFSHILDISAIVRTKALTTLSGCLNSQSKYVKCVMDAVFLIPYMKVCDVGKAPKRSSIKFIEAVKILQESLNPNPTTEVLPDGVSVVKNLFYLCEDDKVMVRKAALLALLHVMRLNFKFITKDVLETVSSHSQDTAIVIRKMLAQELTAILLYYPTHPDLSMKWVESLMPLLVDHETKVVEKACEGLEQAILDNIVPRDRMNHPKHQLPWILIQHVSSFQMDKFFSRACKIWKDTGVLNNPSGLVSAIKSHFGSGNNTAAWSLLMMLSAYVTIPNPTFVLEYYHTEVRDVAEVSTYLSKLVVEVLWCSWKKLPAAQLVKLAEELLDDLVHFRVPVYLIQRSVSICSSIKHHLTHPDQDPRIPSSPQWAVQLTKQCEVNIFNMLESHAAEVTDEGAMKRFIITLGDAALICPLVVENRTVQQLRFMLRTPSSDAGIDMWTGSCSDELKAGLLITLGKLGLQSEQRAQDLVSIIGPLLRETEDSTIKNNIMICLTDICYRYTSLVEGYLPDMCVCLKDPQRVVRENSMVLLIQLLVEDYLKMRHGLIFHLLSMLNDEDPNIRSMTRTFFVGTVLPKKKNCFVSNFIQALFLYNGYQRHPQYSRVILTPTEQNVFDLRGAVCTVQRRNIYRFMLTNMEDDHRFSVSRLLCADICSGVLDGKVLLDEQGQWVLKDALYVLGCDEIRLTERKENEDDLPVEEEEIAQMMVVNARKKMLSELVKKHVVENEAPALINLHKKLAETRSPLVKNVLKLLKIMLRDYKIELTEVLESQPDLAAELRLSMRHLSGDLSGRSSASCESSDCSDNENQGYISDCF